ncbi:MAG: hypothetical protein ACYTEK_06910, partial [Planctomycetota bacterium]
RRILFLRPGLFLLLDEIEAPTVSQYQWMLHAFEKMDIKRSKITSRRKAATLEVHLACPQGLSLSQTNQFDTPYNHGIPKAYHRQRANHWHVKAETVAKSNVARIGAVMAVFGDSERFEVRLQEQNGWFGATAAGHFGRVEGWIRTGDVDTVPEGYTSGASDRRIDLCGRGRDGEICSV